MSKIEFSNKNTFFPHEMDKLTVVLMSIKTLNKERRPLVDISRAWKMASSTASQQKCNNKETFIRVHTVHSVGLKK